MLIRPTDPKWTRPKTKPLYGRKIDVAGGEQIYAEECSEAVWAAFCLAKMGDIQSVPTIQKPATEYQGPDKDLLNKALQRLQAKGDRTPADKK